MRFEENMLSRIPTGTTVGKSKVIRAALAAGTSLSDGVRAASARDDLSPKGRAALIEKEIKSIGAALSRSRRQFEYHERKLDAQRAAVRKKAVGEPKPTDAEYRTFLRSLSEAARVQKLLTDAPSRAAALREPGLSAVNEDVLSRALEIATRENAASEAAALEVAEEAQSVHKAAIAFLTRGLLETPFILEPSGAVRKLHSVTELESYLKKEVPMPHANMMILEEVEADQVEAA